MSEQVFRRSTFRSRARRRIVAWFRARPWIYVPLRCATAKDADGVSRALNPRTEIVIDAFPRSGNSFATVAFQDAQVKNVAVAHHFHAAASILYGASHSIPSLTFVRNPDDACLSYALFSRTEDLDSVFQEYVNFYELILPVRQKLVVARFETVIRDFGLVVDKVNDVFGTKFTSFQHTPENVARVNAILAERTTRRHGIDGFGKGHGESPSAVKDELKADISTRLHDNSLHALRQKAISLHKTFDGGADV